MKKEGGDGPLLVEEAAAGREGEGRGRMRRRGAERQEGEEGPEGGEEGKVRGAGIFVGRWDVALGRPGGRRGGESCGMAAWGTGGGTCGGK